MEKIVSLDTDQNAWNIDGSASDRPPYQSSWIQEWEEATDRARGCCSYVGCKNIAVDGGHVCISRLKSVYIAPICKKCNYYENTRWQQGSKSKIRRGTVLLQRPYTSDMLNATRRISSLRRCQECGQSISGAPKNHLFCSVCFTSDTPRVVTHPTSPTRRCQGCSSDISDRPSSHHLCYDCFKRSESINSNRSVKRQRRQCECCGGKCASISPPKHRAIRPVDESDDDESESDENEFDESESDGDESDESD